MPIMHCIDFYRFECADKEAERMGNSHVILKNSHMKAKRTNVSLETG